MVPALAPRGAERVVSAAGGIGGLSATAPAQALIEPLGWRGLFYVLSGSRCGAALLVFFVVPEKRLPGKARRLRTSSRPAPSSAGRVLAHRARVVVCRGLSVAAGPVARPWLYDVAGENRSAVANYLPLTAARTPWARCSSAPSGAAPMRTFKIGLVLSAVMFARSRPACVPASARSSRYGFRAISAALAYAVLTPLFPPEMTGRVNTASNVLMFGFSFAFQWGIGAVLRLYPVADGRYAPEGYAMALWIVAFRQRTLAGCCRCAAAMAQAAT